MSVKIPRDGAIGRVAHSGRRDLVQGQPQGPEAFQEPEVDGRHAAAASGLLPGPPVVLARLGLVAAARPR
jgi:hypothetical protein